MACHLHKAFDRLERGCNFFVRVIHDTEKEKTMDFERLEQFVLRCPLQELEFRDESGIYVLGNSHTKPAKWSIRHDPVGLFMGKTYEVRGLKTVVSMIEQAYPSFYAWLLLHFS